MGRKWLTSWHVDGGDLHLLRGHPGLRGAKQGLGSYSRGSRAPLRPVERPGGVAAQPGLGVAERPAGRALEQQGGGPRSLLFPSPGRRPLAARAVGQLRRLRVRRRAPSPVAWAGVRPDPTDYAYPNSLPGRVGGGAVGHAVVGEGAGLVEAVVSAVDGEDGDAGRGDVAELGGDAEAQLAGGGGAAHGRGVGDGDVQGDAWEAEEGGAWEAVPGLLAPGPPRRGRWWCYACWSWREARPAGLRPHWPALRAPVRGFWAIRHARVGARVVNR